MMVTDLCAERLTQKLRHALPLAAHARPPLTAKLRQSFSYAMATARLTVMDVFYAGEDSGLMCRIDVQAATGGPFLLVAPLTQVAFGRRHPAAQDIAAYRKQRVEKSRRQDSRGQKS